MPLTPAEVHNVVFKKPPIGKRGYDEEEVDAFLDIIEVELARLVEENADLKSRPASGGTPSNTGAADAAALASAREENKKLAARVSELEAQVAQGRQAAPQAQQELTTAKSTAPAGVAAATSAQSAAQAGNAGATLSQAERVLAMAQQAADEQAAAAKAEHDKTIADAKTHQERVQAETQAFREKTVSEAQARADQLDRDSRAKATSTVSDAEQRANQITVQLEQRKTALEKKLEELRTFEHEYRLRLKSYLESQLRDLDSSGRAEPVAASGSAERASGQAASGQDRQGKKA